jgi:hypothetical protein
MGVEALRACHSLRRQDSQVHMTRPPSGPQRMEPMTSAYDADVEEGVVGMVAVYTAAAAAAAVLLVVVAVGTWTQQSPVP